MATEQQLIAALRQADAAGDDQAAQRFAQLIREGRANPVQEDAPQQRTSDTFSTLGLNIDKRSKEEVVDYNRGVLRQGAQGATLGFADEGEARIVSMLSNKTYKEARDEIRELNNEFSEENPGVSLAANVVGGAVTGGAGLSKSLGSTAVKTTKQKLIAGTASGGGIGAAAGVGTSEGETAGEIAVDGAIGAAIGAPFGFAVAGVNSYVASKAANNERLKQAITERPSRKIVQDMVKGGEKAGASKGMIEAHKNGIDDGVIAFVKGTDKANKRQMQKMIDIQERAMDDRLFARRNTATDVVGERIERGYRYVMDKNKEAGTAIDAASKSLKGQDLDFAPLADDFLQELDIAGVKLTEKGLNFKDSDYANFPASQRLIKAIVKDASTVDDAFGAHKLKRMIDKLVTYGKSNNKSADADATALVKEFRHKIDSVLDGKFPDYDAANTDYAKTIKALNDANDLIGKNSDLASPNFARTLGMITNRQASRSVTGGRVTDAFDQLDDVAMEMGADFADDYEQLAAFSDEIDRRFGTTLVHSMQGQNRNAGQQILEARSVRGVLADKAKDIVGDVFNRTDEDAFKALRLLLSE